MISLIGATKKSDAFTLIEVLLVLVITGIIVALAAPNFSKGYSRFQLNKTADDLLTVSRWAQAMAMGQERIYALTFSDDQRSYELMRADVNELNEESGDQGDFEPVNGTLGRMYVIPAAVRLVMTQAGDTQETRNADRIEFYPDGTIDPAKIQLSSSEQKTTLSSTEVRGMLTKADNE